MPARPCACAGPADHAIATHAASATRNGRTSLPQLGDLALPRLLVRPPSDELRSVADSAAGDVVEGHLADELRAQPLPDQLLLRLPAAWLARAALVRAVGLEQLEQLALLLRPEARRVPHDVELAVVVHAEDQRAHRVRLLAEPERRHHRIGRPDALDLQHAGALARPVRRVSLLGDHTLAGSGEPFAGVLGVARHRGELHRVRHQRREASAALLVGQVEEGLVTHRQKVERDQLGRGLAGEHLHPRGRRVDPLREQVELLDPVHHHDHLAVEHQPLGGQLQHLLDHIREVAVHRTTVAALEVYLRAVAKDDRAEAVPLRLEAPAVAGGQLLRRAGELRLDGRRERKGHVRGTLALIAMTIEEACALFEADGVYLNTASFGLPPRPAWDALQAALHDWRAGRTSWEGWNDATDAARASFARLCGVPVEWVAVGGTVSGLVGLVAAAASAAHHGALTLVDATHACGWMPFDGRRFDAFVCAAYKWLLSPRGTAFMGIRPALLERLTPQAAGWFAGDGPHTSYYGPPLRLPATARRLDVSPAWFSWVGTAPALEVILDVGVEAINEHDLRLANRFRGGLGLEPGDSTIVAAEVPGAEELLYGSGVMTARRAGMLRTSWHLCNTEEGRERGLELLSPVAARRSRP